MSELLELLEYTVSEVVPSEAKYVLGSDPVIKAIELMKANKTGCCLVIDEKVELQGIFTERDLLNKVVQNPQSLELPVSQFMTSRPQTIKANESVVIALQMMSNGGFRNIPVINLDGKATGLISMSDIMSFFTNHLRDD